MRIVADYHTHTRYSHGRGTVADNVRAALAHGLTAVGIADHGHRSLPWVRATPAGLAAMVDDVRLLRPQAGGISVLAGVEANIVTPEGDLDVPAETRRRLDLVLAGLHPLFVPPSWKSAWTLIGLNWLVPYSPSARARARVLNTRAVINAVLRHQIDVITHPGWGLDIDTRELARACARAGTAMEINAGHGHISVEYCRIAAAEGAVFCIGSDAHAPEQVGRLEAGVRIAVAAGLRPEQVANAEGGPGLRSTPAAPPAQGPALRTVQTEPGGGGGRDFGGLPPDPGTAWSDWARQGRMPPDGRG